MKDVFIIDGKRTCIGKMFGALKGFSAPQLAGVVLKNLAAGYSLKEEDFDFAFIGQAVKAGQGQNPARQALHYAGLGFGIPSLTIDMVCGSGLIAVEQGRQSICSDSAECVIAGGMESSSRAPFILERNRNLLKMGSLDLQDALLKDGLFCSFGGEHMGYIAERTARRHNVSREDQDKLACRSHSNAVMAREKGWTQDEIVPVSPGMGEGCETDENIRPKTSEKSLARLPALFGEGGSVTAGNSPPPADAAAMVILATQEFCGRHDIRPAARIVATAVVSLEPEDIFLASGKALDKVLLSSGLVIDDIDFFEINESFGVQAVLSKRELNIPDDKFNIRGGSIALGHPLAASGTRCLVTLMHVLKSMKARYGAASICLGGGCAVSVIIENLIS